MRQELADTGEQLVRTQAARDRNALRIQQLSRGGGAAAGEAPPEGDPSGEPGARLTGSLTGNKENAEPGDGGDSDLLHGYLERIARLEKEVRRLRQARARLLVVVAGMDWPMAAITARMQRSGVAGYTYVVLRRGESVLSGRT